MPKLSEHHSSQFTKLIYIGDSGTGKTGSLVSLLAAGYNLRILDMDNGLDSLKNFASKECPHKLDNVSYITLRDKMRSGPAGPVVSNPKAFTDSLKYLTKWDDESDPAEWGTDTFFVLDSASAWGRAAFNWAVGLNPTAKDPRQWYFTAQKAIEDAVTLISGESFRTNVILISHVNYRELQDGTTKGYPNAIGSALGPVIARYFNTLLLAESSGSGKGTRRRIKTLPTGVIDLKNPAPFKVEAEYPLETGLADIVAKIREG